MPRQGATHGRSYRMNQEGQPSQRSNFGMYVLKDNAGFQIYRPTWQGTRTIFRIFPGRNPENPSEWDKFRLSDEDRDFGDWIRRYDIAFSFGVSGATFITKDPRDGTIDDQQNPVWMVYKSITQAVKSGQGEQAWNPLVFGQPGRGAPLSPVKDGYVIQGILMEHKSKPQSPPRGCLMEHSPVMLLLSQSAGAALLDKLSEKTEDGAWRWPDITALDGGMFVQFHQAGTQSHNAGAPQSMDAPNHVGSRGMADKAYEVELLERYGTVPPTYDAIHAVADAHVKPWDDIIRIPTVEEQVRLLCGAGIPATAIVYALGDMYREYIPPHVFDQAMAQRTSTVVPGARPAGWQTGDVPANPMGGAPANPMGGAPANPMGGAPANPMGGAPANPMSQQAAPAAQPADTPPWEGAPAGNGGAAAAGFDPPPTHVSNEAASATMSALERARARARQAG
jgi:hypothetical protein